MQNPDDMDDQPVPVAMLFDRAGFFVFGRRSQPQLPGTNPNEGVALLTAQQESNLSGLQPTCAQIDTVLALENELPGELMGASAGLRQVLAMIRKVAATDATVLIRGESGTGKELVARALHYSSSRMDGPFICLNCRPDRNAAGE